MRTLCHCSSFEFNAQAGDSIVLRPGTQNAQGIGVYFSEGTPDERASDSCYENGGAKTIFVLESDASVKMDGGEVNRPWIRKRRDRQHGTLLGHQFLLKFQELTESMCMAHAQDYKINCSTADNTVVLLYCFYLYMYH